MPRIATQAATIDKAALPQLTRQMREELIPDPVTKEQFEDIFQNFKRELLPQRVFLEDIRQGQFAGGGQYAVESELEWFCG